MSERFVYLNIVVGDPDLDSAQECATCGFDALFRFPLHGLSDRGVTPWGTYSACVRCYSEANDD